MKQLHEMSGNAARVCLWAWSSVYGEETLIPLWGRGSECRAATGMSERAYARALSELESEGWIDRPSGARAGKWLRRCHVAPGAPYAWRERPVDLDDPQDGWSAREVERWRISRDLRVLQWVTDLADQAGTTLVDICLIQDKWGRDPSGLMDTLESLSDRGLIELPRNHRGRWLVRDSRCAHVLLVDPAHSDRAARGMAELEDARA